MGKRGPQPRPDARKVAKGLRLSPSAWGALESLAAERGTSQTSILESLIEKERSMKAIFTVTNSGYTYSVHQDRAGAFHLSSQAVDAKGAPIESPRILGIFGAAQAVEDRLSQVGVHADLSAYYGEPGVDMDWTSTLT